jgi:Ca2+ transporting ATPase
MFDNSLFVGILFTTAVLQVLIVEFGSIAFKVVEGGLDAKYWGVSLMLGAGSLPVQQVINVLFRMGQKHIVSRNRKRSTKLGHMTTKRTNGSSSRLPVHPHQE